MIIALVWKRFMAKWRQDLKMNVSFRWRQKWDKILSAGGKEAKCQSWAKGWHASANCYQATADGGGDDDGAGGRDNAGDDGGGGGGDDDDDEDDGPSLMVVVLVMKNMMTCIVHMLASNSRWTWSRPPHNIRALRQDKLKIRDIKMATVKEQDKMFSWHIEYACPTTTQSQKNPVGIADRKVFARLESFCAYLQNIA